MKWWLALYIGMQAFDMATTAYKIHQGCHEAVWPNAPLMYSTKSAGIGVTIALNHQHEHSTVVKVIAGTGIVSGAIAGTYNLSVSCH